MRAPWALLGVKAQLVPRRDDDKGAHPISTTAPPSDDDVDTLSQNLSESKIAAPAPSSANNVGGSVPVSPPRSHTSASHSHSSSTPSKASGCSDRLTCDETVHASEVERAIEEDLVGRELLARLQVKHACTPESTATLEALVARAREHPAIVALQALKRSAPETLESPVPVPEALWEQCFVEACNVILLMLHDALGSGELDELAGRKGYFVANGKAKTKLTVSPGALAPAIDFRAVI